MYVNERSIIENYMRAIMEISLENNHITESVFQEMRNKKFIYNFTDIEYSLIKNEYVIALSLIHILTVNADTVAAGEKENIKTVTDATLINNKNSLYVAQMLLNSYQKRIEQNLSFVLNRETVGSNASVEVYKDYFKNAVITKLETDLVNGFVTKAVVIGE